MWGSGLEPNQAQAHPGWIRPPRVTQRCQEVGHQADRLQGSTSPECSPQGNELAEGTPAGWNPPALKQEGGKGEASVPSSPAPPS